MFLNSIADQYTKEFTHPKSKRNTKPHKNKQGAVDNYYIYNHSQTFVFQFKLHMRSSVSFN